MGRKYETQVRPRVRDLMLAWPDAATTRGLLARLERDGLGQALNWNGAQTGQVYRIAGGAPIYVSPWSAFGGGQPTVAVDQAAIDNAGAGGPNNLWNHLSYRPANGTFINGAQTGQVYRIAGGAPIYVSTWSAPSAVAGRRWPWTRPPSTTPAPAARTTSGTT